MKKKTSQTTTIRSTWAFVTAALIMSLSLSSQAAETGVVVTEDLQDAAEGASVLRLTDGSIRVKFYASDGIPPYRIGSLIGTMSALVGDYDLANAAGLSVNLKLSGGARTDVYVVLESSTGREWKLRCSGIDSAAAGVWYTEHVSFDFNAGWVWTGGVKDTLARWQEDLTKVDTVKIQVFPSSYLMTHDCTLDALQLRLSKDLIVPLTVLEAKIQEVFGTASLTAAQKAIDTDGDGQTDYQEIMYTQTDYRDANSSMGLKAAAKSANGISISWACVLNGVYAVTRAPAPGGPYTDVVRGLIGPENGTMSFEDTTVVDGPYFYRVIMTN